WSWVWDHLRPWHTLGGTVLALLPAFGGYSAASGWAHAVHSCRVESGPGGGYTLALGALLAASVATWRRPYWATRTALVIALAGCLGAVHPFDPVTGLTGVPL
ncbi:MAG: hypothetical protein LC792_18230, partial [Actinobacteria bacterium]|nr:hypothetical protein [Actinomycetota bacterium]